MAPEAFQLSFPDLFHLKPRKYNTIFRIARNVRVFATNVRHLGPKIRALPVWWPTPLCRSVWVVISEA